MSRKKVVARSIHMHNDLITIQIRDEPPRDFGNHLLEISELEDSQGRRSWVIHVLPEGD